MDKRKYSCMMFFIAFLENLATLSAFSCVAAFAPGWWKILAPLALLNITSVRSTPEPDDKEDEGKTLIGPALTPILDDGIDRAHRLGYEAALLMVSKELVARREQELVQEVAGLTIVQQACHKGAVAALHSMNQMVEAIDTDEV